MGGKLAAFQYDLQRYGRQAHKADVDVRQQEGGLEQPMKLMRKVVSKMPDKTMA
jgi:hypothetical protein